MAIVGDTPALIRGQILGTATNDSAAADYVGEYVTATLTFASRTALSTTVAKNITSMSLTAGDWDVSTVGYIRLANTTNMVYAEIGLNTVSATQPSTEGTFNSFGPLVASANINLSGSTSGYRLSLNATTTVYLIATSAFSASTIEAWGWIAARRLR